MEGEETGVVYTHLTKTCRANGEENREQRGLGTRDKLSVIHLAANKRICGDRGTVMQMNVSTISQTDEG